MLSGGIIKNIPLYNRTPEESLHWDHLQTPVQSNYKM